jgi:two-component system alkaline phosphatase synthesis response regulator PhoP
MAIKILAVDDDPDVRRLVRIKLKKAGYEVVMANDGEEGVKKALEERPDLVILDVMMPKMDGFAALEQIKTGMDPAPIVLMLTGEGEQDDLVHGLSGGADDYIVKPFAPRELVARVNVALIKAGKGADVPDA